MSLIFMLCLESDLALDSGDTFQFSYPRLNSNGSTPQASIPKKSAKLPFIFTISHVCRRWREIVFQDPILWCRIRTYRPECMFAMLERSKQAPLSLDLRFEVNEADPGFLFYKQVALDINTARLKKLSLTMSKVPHMAQGTLDLLASPAPFLETLEIRIDPIWSVSVDPAALVTDSLFAGMAQRLRSLTLVNCFFSGGFPLLHALKTLKLGNSVSFNRPGADVLLSYLRRMPLLETLILDDVILSETPTRPNDFVPVALPHLSSLSWYSRDLAFLPFWTGISLHHVPTIDLSITLDPSSAWSAMPALRSLSTGSGPHGQPFRALELGCYPLGSNRRSIHQRIQLKAWRTSDTNREPDFSLCSNYYMSRVPLERLLQEMCANVYSKNLLVLILSGNRAPKHTHAQNRDIFGPLSSITDLRIVGEHTGKFLTTITTPASTDSKLVFLFPTLSRLEIHKAPLNVAKTKKSLQTRSKFRAVDTLHLVDCSLTEGAIEILSSVALDVRIFSSHEGNV
ncbi:hypothetical protein DENSPDRAFT_836757 [Dentipellis sp. KUC8613]|nr:hypothetical protein DENSPDRAFT_836757 [Dentipellis sp. KUC8613]